jgi:hypothetical protein
MGHLCIVREYYVATYNYLVDAWTQQLSHGKNKPRHISIPD